MAKNDFKAFALGVNANVLTQEEYEALDAVDTGFQSGIARSEQLNKVWRQSSAIAATVANFIASRTGDDVLDDGDLNKLQTSLLKALLNNSTMQLDGRYLNIAKNLSDLSDPTKARKSLGLKGAAVLDVGTTTNTVAAGNDSRIVNAVQRGNNLSDLTNASVARGNLGLGNSATLDIGTTTGTVAAGDDSRIVNAVQRTGDKVPGEIKFSGLNSFRLYNSDYGAIFRRSEDSMHIIPTAKGQGENGNIGNLRPLSINLSNGNVSLGHSVDISNDFTVNGNIWCKSSVYVGDNDSGLSVNGDGSVQFVANGLQQGYWNTSEFRWGKSVAAPAFYDATQYDTKINIYPRGSGAFASQLDSGAPFYQQYFEWNVNSGGCYVPLIKGRSARSGRGWTSAVSFGYLLPDDDSFPYACVHVIGDATNRTWYFNSNNGEFVSPGSVLAGSARYQDNGNVNGSIWGGWLSDWLNNQFSVRDNNINSRATWDWVGQNFVGNIKLGAEGIQGGWRGGYVEARAPAGTVLTGLRTSGTFDMEAGDDYFYYRSIQKYVNSAWYTIGQD